MDVDVVRAVRLWYSPAAAELAIDLKPEENESRLGVGISCTEEVRDPSMHFSVLPFPHRAIVFSCQG